jgi:hypothetical protein
MKRKSSYPPSKAAIFKEEKFRDAPLGFTAGKGETGLLLERLTHLAVG